MVLFAVPAYAAVVDVWEYKYDAGFVEWSFGGGLYNLYEASNEVDLAGTTGYRKLAWGDGFLGSGSYIEFIAPVSGQVLTDGPIAPTMKMQHSNDLNAMFSNPLQSGKVKATLELQSLLPASGPQSLLSAELIFSFYDITAGSDFFILDNPEVTLEGFEYEGEYYTLNFGGSFRRLDLPEQIMTELQLDSSKNYYGWETAENGGFTSVDTGFIIKHTGSVPTPTPEPGTLALMGLGLAALGGFLRFKRNAM